jgi:hypothetical protein
MTATGDDRILVVFYVAASPVIFLLHSAAMNPFPNLFFKKVIVNCFHSLEEAILL